MSETFCRQVRVTHALLEFSVRLHKAKKRKFLHPKLSSLSLVHGEVLASPPPPSVIPHNPCTTPCIPTMLYPVLLCVLQHQAMKQHGKTALPHSVIPCTLHTHNAVPCVTLCYSTR